ncbi:MAG: stage II sporulation protein P [Desulfitobacterium sp.]
MLKEEMFSAKKLRWSFWPSSRWARGFLFILLILLFLSLFFYAMQKGTSRQLIRVMAQQSFPFEAIVLEGIPGYSLPEREHLNQVRAQGVSLGTFLLTGVNIADARTYFFSYYTPPPDGPAWIGWAYNSGDPEYEGEIPELEEIPLNPGQVREGVEKPAVPLDDEVLVGIYHTHNAESYAGDGGGERDEDGNGEIMAVGEKLKKGLESKGVRAIQALDAHELDDFNKAYSKSVNTATALVRNYPSIKLLLDVHRDGLLGVNKSTVMIEGKEVGRVMIVIGQKNPHWEKNEALAKELIAFAEARYPGLFIPKITYASDARYNQHLLDGAILLEIGSQLNTFDEAKGTAEVLSDLLAEWLERDLVQSGNPSER